MYNDYFGFREAPFSIAPNPQFLYMSERHREALAHLLYGIKSDGGFILLTGEVGTGKTTVCRCLLEQIPEDVDTAFILNPKLTAHELLATACDDLGIEYPDNASIKVLVDRLNDFLLAAWDRGRRTVLIIDEAQNLSIDVLEQLRLLTNLETNQRKLLQIILLGQPELLEILDRKELRQLSQRVTARFHLTALTRDETAAYIDHRLEVAGARGRLFPANTINRIYHLSAGIPRLINLICDRSLLGAYANNRLQVNRATVDRAAEEILGHHARDKRRPGYLLPVAAVLLLFGLTVSGYVIVQNRQQPAMEAPVALADAPESSEESAPDQAGAPRADPVSQDPGPRSQPVVTATATPIEPPPQLDSLIMLEGDSSFGDAMSHLFDLWGVPATASAQPCELASRHQLKCLSLLGSLRDVRHLNRPAVVRLDIAGLEHFFAITGIEPGVVELRSNAGAFKLAQTDLLRAWDGNYTILWQMPPDYRVVSQGDSGSIVDWLGNQLAIADESGDEPATGTSFDETLTERIKRFQIRAGLKPDGIAGDKTWIHLNDAVGKDVPRLVSLDAERAG